MPLHTVAVRALCEFTAKAGDLDLRFTPAPSAQEGIDGHAWVARQRGPGYETEVTLSAHCEVDGGELQVRGRADGWDPVRQRLEEIKTHRGRLERQPANHRALHWAQAETYGWLICQARGLDGLTVALVYLDIATQRETVFTREATAAELRAVFEFRCRAYIAWAEREHAHRLARDAALQALAFPHPAFRTGQRPLAEAVYRAARDGRCLMAQAPTGIGKTVGTLYPLLKAMPERLDRVYFLTAKTSGRAVALDALATLASADPAAPTPLRVLELVARDKACEHPDKSCHGESCPLARGFYDRLPSARAAALALPQWRREPVRALAATQTVCPYYLAQELVRWADVVVGDYNHWFDASALLHGQAVQQGWRVALLVDEGHNLVERSRAMYSAALGGERLRATTRLGRSAGAPVKRALTRLRKAWKGVLADAGNAAVGAPDASPEGPDAPIARAMPATTTVSYRLLDAPPDALVEALQAAASAILDQMADRPESVDAELLEVAFEALAFTRLTETFGPHTLVDLCDADTPAARLSLRNVIPAGYVSARLADAHSTTVFSATLQPQRFHARLLGLPDDTVWVDVDAPFAAEQLAVHVARDLSTRWAHRAASLPRLVERLARQYVSVPGHYLAFFSSFDYLDQVHRAFVAAHPSLPCWTQRRGMSEPEQSAFLARFVPGGRGIGFAVLGGAFAEGIDLPGDRLIGAFIATLGLPQINPVNEQIRQRIDTLLGGGQGFDYTYLYPGVQKVVQAAGRVIRTPTDRGVVHLLDDRFGRADVQALLPRWWSSVDSGGR